MKKLTSLGLLSFTAFLASGCVADAGSAESERAAGEGITAAPPPSLAPTTMGVCGAPAPGSAQCHAIVVTESDGRTARTSSTPAGLTPAQLTSAYNIPAGFGGTVAIVDAYDNPNAEADLAVYRAQFGLPPCTTANGCFRKVNQTGAASPLPAANTSWAPEIALDLDMASAGCPGCNILLLEGNTANFSDLGTAVNTAAAMGATVISNSYSAPEGSYATSFDTAYYNHPGVAILASTGDSGSASGLTPGYPASGAHVIAVGGTSLHTASNFRGWTETAWSGAGAGCSQYVAKPAWQTDPSCPKRMVGDISAVADPSTAVAVYDTYGGYTGWVEFGGTSVASPLVAAILADTGRGGIDAGWLYAHPGALYDVTSGSSGTSTPPYFTTAQVGYDGPTGLGTPNAAAFASPECGILFAGQYLSPGQLLYSCDHSHVLSQQSDGNVVLYHVESSGWVPTWSSGTWSSGGHFTSIGYDGNFVVYNASWQGEWQSGTWGHPGAVLSVQNDGNMVVYSNLWAPLWASNTWHM
jgi:subtilase family serine protease